METTRQCESSRYFAALYMRLSRDDEGAAESASITTQRKMLRAYARENHFTVYGEYIDDGISGTTFDRPNFKRMIQDIEDKKVNLVLTKDLSRLGRDYIQAGQYTEIYFPSKKVRYIAINDGYDSESPCTDIAPFKNVINEMYARDTSRKIRSALAAHMREGAFVGAFAPYGYRRDPADKHHLVVDEAPARIVKEIFRCAAAGMLPVQIARMLNARGELTPAMYRCQQNPSLNPDDYSRKKEWTSATITKMLRNVVYLGHMAQGKTSKVSFKSDVVVRNPRDDWFMVANTHEAVVAEEVFDLACRRSRQRTCKKQGQFRNLFSGIAKCAGCGRNMSTAGTRKKGAVYNLTCGGYKLYGSGECSNHFIDYATLVHIVLSSIQEVIRLTQQEEEQILAAVQKKTERQLAAPNRQKEADRLQKRGRELDSLIEKLYEDNVQGLLSTDRMKKLLGKYEAESRNIDARLAELAREHQPEQPENYSAKLKRLLDSYTHPAELTPELLYRLVDHIEIGQGSYHKTEAGKYRQQTVKIYFRFRGSPYTRTYTA